jgi:hypothetical protein
MNQEKLTGKRMKTMRAVVSYLVHDRGILQTAVEWIDYS